MNSYVTGLTIKTLREGRNMTQAELAERIGVSSKTFSKWETAKGLPDEDHGITAESVEDEHFVTVHHPMTKAHFISFIAFVTSDRLQLVKLYPEGNAETRLQLRGMGRLYYYCNRHGLFKRK